MRKQFIFDSLKETPTAYLTRMSPILGALRKDGASAANQQLISSIGIQEQKEIENEMCKAFERTISTETRRIIKCKAAPEVKDKIIYERIAIERPKSGIAPYSEFEEYVSTTYIDIETTYASMDSLRKIINMAYAASQEYDEIEVDEQEPEDDLLTAEEARETICEHIDNSVGFIERISTWSQEKIKMYWVVIALFTMLWNIFVLPYLQENIGKPAMAAFTSNVKELPEKGTAIVCQLKENIEAYITENTNYYYKVSFTDENGIEREGYVAKRNLRIIQEEQKEIEENEDEEVSQEDSLLDTL